MFGSSILDTAIGMLMMYLLLSLMASALQESIEGMLKVRATNLEQGLRELLQDPDGKRLTQHIYNHPLIFGLFRGTYDPDKVRSGITTKLPTYIPAANFAAALIDILVRGPVERNGNAPAPTRELSFESLRAAVAIGSHLGGPLQRALLMALDSAQGDLAKAQANIEAWFDSSMDRVSGWYKRYTQWVLLLIAVVTAVLLNVDSVRVAKELYLNDALRAAAVAQAGALTKSETVTKGSIDAATAALNQLQLPIGWTSDKDFTKLQLAFGVPRKGEGAAVASEIGGYAGHRLIGWFITAIAISFGAPFWFDLLNKLMVIRSTVKPHEKSPEEASEDRQRPDSGFKSWQVSSGAARQSAPAAPAAPAAPFQPHQWAADEDPDGGKI